jgi:large subunit ribosomal protein L22
MQYKVKLKNLRISPRKVRLVVDVVRGKKAEEALLILKSLNKRASEPVYKLISSGLANAKNQGVLNPEKVLFIKEIFVDEGPTMKRFMPRAMGRATTIRKNFSHITVTLSEMKENSDPNDSKDVKTRNSNK